MTVVLTGREGGTTHREVALLGSLPPELRLIGGLAVMCRVGAPHRATVDIDALARNMDDMHELLSHLAVTATDGHRYSFAGDMSLDVIEVSPDPADELAAYLVDRGPLSDLEVNAIAHVWAHDTASILDVVAVDELSGTRLARAGGRLVATTPGLVAMKASTVGLRASSKPEKRASDLYDLGRLLADGSLRRGDLTELPTAALDPLMERLAHHFIEPAGRDRTYREIRRFGEPEFDLDAAADAVEFLGVS